MLIDQFNTTKLDINYHEELVMFAHFQNKAEFLQILELAEFIIEKHGIKSLKLYFYWQQQQLTLDLQQEYQSFINKLKEKKLRLCVPFAKCSIPEFRNSRYAKFAKLNCKDCFFKKANKCNGVFSQQFLDDWFKLENQEAAKGDLTPMSNKPLEEVKIEDFFKTKPLITWWVPRAIDILRMVKLASLLSPGKNGKILDIASGQGFLGYLMARMGKIEVTGIDLNTEFLKKSVYQAENLELKNGDIFKLDPSVFGNFEIAFNSWMPYHVDFSGAMKRLKPKALVYVRDKGIKNTGIQYPYLLLKIDPAKNEFYMKEFEAKSYLESENYRTFARWDVVSNIDLKKNARNPESQQTSGEILVQLRKDISLDQKELNVSSNEKYPWEKDLGKRGFKRYGNIT